MKLTVILILVLLILSSKSLSQSAYQKMQIEVEVLAVMARQARSWNSGDVRGFMEGYWRSDQLVFASGDQITRGWQPTLERYLKAYDTRAKMGELTFADISVNVLSKDFAVVLGSWSLKRETDAPKGKFTLIFRRLKEGWRIIHDHTS